MKGDQDEDELLREVALQSARNIFLARQRAEEELLRTQEALRRQSEWLRVTLASIGDAVLTADRSGRVLSLNAVAERLTGSTQDEALGRPLTEVFRIINEETRQPVENPSERVLREGQIVGLENHTILIAKDGTETPIDDSVAPIRDGAGHVHGVVLIFRSIAERKQAEKALRKSERELADFFENASVGLHLVGPDGIILRANQTELRLLGYTREEYVGHHITEFHVDQDVITDMLRRLSSGQALESCAARMRCKDGSIKDVLVDSSVLWEDGRFIHTRCFTRDVTDRKRAEEAQARLAAIVESSQDAIISKTLEGRIVSWNGGAERIFGYRAEEIIGQSITRLLPADRHDEERMILERLRRGEHIEHYETVRVTKQGRRIDVDLTLSPLRDSAGRIIGASKISRDITARKRAEQRLAAQYGVTQTLAESASLDEAAPKILRAMCEQLDWPVGALWIVDKQNKVLRCLEVCCRHGLELPRFASRSREQALERGMGLPGRVWATGKSELIRDVALEENFPRAASAAAEGLHGAFGFPITLNGEILGVIELFSQEIQQPEAELLAMLTAISSQIGQFIERRRAEEALRKSEERLAAELAATSRLHAVSSRMLSANDLTTALNDVLENAMAMCGADFGDIQLYNPQIEALEIVAQRGFQQEFLDYFRTVRVEEGSACAGALKSGRRIIIEDVQLDPAFEPHRQVAAAAGFRAVQSTPLKTSMGTVVGMLSTHFRAPHRISERDQRLLDLYARNAVDLIERLRFEQTLKESDRRKDEFLAILAHELRNPLAPIRNAVQILRAKGPPVPELMWAREMIDRQLGQLTRLVDDLLDVSRITRGKIELRKQWIELRAVVNMALDASRPLIEKRNQVLSVELPSEPIMLDADPTRLAQALLNLLNNAAKFTEPGGRIWLTAERQGGQAVVRVKDTGVGIPPDMLPRIFEMFTQVDLSIERSQGGLGIGLTLAQRLIAMHGGELQARSEGLGQGSEFIVRLPVAEEKYRAALQGSAEDKRLRVARPLRILVVDDNRDAADSLAMVLGMTGHEVRIAHDGLAAVDEAAAFQPSVILLDIGLPKLNGYEAAHRIRKSLGGAVVLVALTGWGQEEDRRRAKEAGFDHHLTKPVELDRLKQLLAEVVPRDRE